MFLKIPYENQLWRTLQAYLLFTLTKQKQFINLEKNCITLISNPNTLSLSFQNLPSSGLRHFLPVRMIL